MERFNSNETAEAVRFPLSGIPLDEMIAQINREGGNTGRLIR